MSWCFEAREGKFGTTLPSPVCGIADLGVSVRGNPWALGFHPCSCGKRAIQGSKEGASDVVILSMMSIVRPATIGWIGAIWIPQAASCRRTRS